MLNYYIIINVPICKKLQHHQPISIFGEVSAVASSSVSPLGVAKVTSFKTGFVLSRT